MGEPKRSDLPQRALDAVEKYGGWEGVLKALSVHEQREADYLALRAECDAKDARLAELLSLANRAGTFKAANHNGRLLPDGVVDAIISASAPPLHPDFPDDDLYEFCRMVECHVLERLAAIDAGRE